MESAVDLDTPPPSLSVKLCDVTHFKSAFGKIQLLQTVNPVQTSAFIIIIVK
jgi:hypothetical protein